MVDTRFFDLYMHCQVKYGFVPKQILLSFLEYITGRPCTFLLWKGLLNLVENSSTLPFRFNIYAAFVSLECCQNGKGMKLYSDLLNNYALHSTDAHRELTVVQLQQGARNVSQIFKGDTAEVYSMDRDWTITPPNVPAYYTVALANVDDFKYRLENYLNALTNINNVYMSNAITAISNNAALCPEQLVFGDDRQPDHQNNEDLVQLTKSFKVKNLFSKLMGKSSFQANEILWHCGIYL